MQFVSLKSTGHMNDTFPKTDAPLQCATHPIRAFNLEQQYKYASRKLESCSISQTCKSGALKCK